MGKTRKKKLGNQHNQLGGYKKFINDVQATLKLMDATIRLSNMPNNYKRMMYDFRYHILNPTAGNAMINSKELKKIAFKIKTYYRERNIETNGNFYSVYQIMLLYCYSNIRSKMIEKETGDKNDPEVEAIRSTSDGLVSTFHVRFLLLLFRTIVQMSNPCFKYYGVKFRMANLYKENPMLECVTEIFGIPAHKYMLSIDGKTRPTYRLGKVNAQIVFEWLAVEKATLGDFYTGNKQTLDVYIQSHAYERLTQRLDLLDKEAINYLIWENTHTLNKFETYRGYLLSPVKLFDVKVGYFMCKIVDDKLLIRTFLFITHNSTPEGDKLKEISGLGKHDISYWRIDRLSTFVNLNEEKYKNLLTLFYEAGVDDFTSLKNINFHIDQMQALNLDGLMEYLRKG